MAASPGGGNTHFSEEELKKTSKFIKISVSPLTFDTSVSLFVVFPSIGKTKPKHKSSVLHSDSQRGAHQAVGTAHLT